MASYQGVSGVWLTRKMDSKYYYTIRNCFIPYGIVDAAGRVAYEIYWYTDTAGGTRHAASIKDIFRVPHALHPDCPGGLHTPVRDGTPWIGVSVAPTEEELLQIRELVATLQPIPAYKPPRVGHGASAMKYVARMQVRAEQHVSNAPPGPRGVVSFRASDVSEIKSVADGTYFEVYEIIHDKPMVHLYVTHAR